MPPTADTGMAVVDAGDPVIVLSGPTFLPLRTSDSLTTAIYNTDVTTVAWSSSDPSVLIVDDLGNVSAVTPGQSTVTASIDVEGATVSDTLAITVQNDIPFYDAWRGSAHAAYETRPFTHWNEDGAIPVFCAKCHSTPGFEDFLGSDGTPAGVVDGDAALGSAVECLACHNDVAVELDSVTFPSGVTIDGLGSEALCMSCHQGRASGDDLATTFATLGVEPDTVDATLAFTNVHYYPAGATLFAGQVRGGFQYEGQVYDWRFRHVSGYDSCIGCHDPHTLELRVDECAACHTDPVPVEDLDDIRDIRMIASGAGDYDGDGDLDEGIYYEIQGLRTEVLDSLQTYVTDQGQSAICYGDGYPYFFVDSDADGACGASDTTPYDEWSPRSLAAAYNFQLASTDPGNFAHNAKYTIQLLHDSLQDLNLGLTAEKDLSAFVRNDPGHFNGAGEPARHWDEDAEIDARCSQCHGGEQGLEFFLQYGVGLQAEEQDNGLSCETCHVALPDFDQIRPVPDVTFPSEITLASADTTSNLCMTCHSGRTAKEDIDRIIASGTVRFSNIHYRAAGASRFGTLAQVGYEYDGQTYAGEWTTHPGGNECTDCHDPVGTNHSFRVADAFANCTACHLGAAQPDDIRSATLHGEDYDGDGSTTEPLAGELDGLAEQLLTVMTDANAICYGDSYPYFFNDTNDNGVCDGAEAIFPNQYAAWTPALLRAAHNYQFEHTETGAWSHNFDYMGQLLYDSIEDLGGDTSNLVRP